MLKALLLIIYLLPIIGYIIYCGYKHQQIDGLFIGMFIWPCLLPFILIFIIGMIIYLLGEWLDAPLGMNFWEYLLKFLFKL